MADFDYRGVKVSTSDAVAERLPSDYKAGQKSAPAKVEPKKATAKSSEK